MDVAERTRGLAEALGRGPAAAAPFLAERLRIELDGRPVARERAEAWLALAAGTLAPPAVRDVAVKRNVAFCDVDWAGVGAGVAVLSWDQDGRLVHASLQRRL